MADYLTRADKEEIRTALRLHQPIGKKLFPLIESIIERNRREAHAWATWAAKNATEDDHATE